MENSFGRRMRNLSSRARWLIAAATALVFLFITALCSMTSILMILFAANSCSPLPEWAGYYVYLPPAIMVLASFGAPLLFVLRQRWSWIVGTIFVGVGITILLYIAWLPIIFVLC